MTAPIYIAWGPELSPFLLKLEAMLAHHGISWRRLPRDGSRLENLRTSLRINRAIKKRTALRPPANDALDEYPLVPFLITQPGTIPGSSSSEVRGRSRFMRFMGDGQVLYDSTALAAWLDERNGEKPHPLVPLDPAVRFTAALIDEAFDEFGLYMVHHNRWKLAAADNDAPGLRLAHEYQRLLPPGSTRFFARWFARRQVRRLPYLFSVAPEGFEMAGVPPNLMPPSRSGFPPTHELLEESWRRYLRAIEGILETQPFLLGTAFTIADASAYGQLSMNLTDRLAARRLGEIAPKTFAWLTAIRARTQPESTGTASHAPCLQGLLQVIVETYVPLMRANAAACAELLARGESAFNEKAFDSGRSHFDGEMLGHRYRSVAKTFQARSWRDLCASWSALDSGAKRQVQQLLPGTSLEALFVAPRLC